RVWKKARRGMSTGDELGTWRREVQRSLVACAILFRNAMRRCVGSVTATDIAGILHRVRCPALEKEGFLKPPIHIRISLMRSSPPAMLYIKPWDLDFWRRSIFAPLSSNWADEG